MNDWRKQLRFDPLPPLLSSGDEALVYYVRRDLLREDVGPVQRLWQLPGAHKVLKKQKDTPYEKVTDPKGITTEYVRCIDPTASGIVVKVIRPKLSQ